MVSKHTEAYFEKTIFKVFRETEDIEPLSLLVDNYDGCHDEIVEQLVAEWLISV